MASDKELMKNLKDAIDVVGNNSPAYVARAVMCHEELVNSLKELIATYEYPPLELIELLAKAEGR